ncbi:MAG TPA: DUF418 domain-containing protein [Kofleriaceae bacterium]|nr:DUF418 domain-containing protein [Kofleriaceae bacterium]
MGELTPVMPRERVATLDVLRGFALLGVLLANLYALFSFRFASHDQPTYAGADLIARRFMTLFVQHRAQTLLTFLFGLGFAMQLVRASERGQRVLPIYVRRLVALLVIGWCHVLLLSWVDVTWGYALTGFFLLPFVHARDRTRLFWAAALTLIPSAVYAIPEVFAALHALLFDRPRSAYIDDFVAAARSGDRVAILHAHATLAMLWTLGGGVAWYLPWLLGRFLLGFVAGARHLFDRDGADHRALFRGVLVAGALGTAIEFALELLGVFQPTGHGLAFAMIAAVIAQLTLVAQVAMYVAIVVLLMQRPASRRVLVVIAPVGRMPLTTYLMQSLICTSLFYGWGLNWSTPPPAACVGLGLAIFAVQIAIAHAWLRWFRFGPAEWLWRSIVYWQLQPMR